MTTITEAIRVSSAGEILRKGDVEALLENPELARQFATRLTVAAEEYEPGRTWTVAELRAILAVACHGAAQSTATVLEGRYLRKQLKSEARLAASRQEPLTVIVVRLSKELPSPVRGTLLDAISSHIRSGDTMFLYRRRIALLLPRVGAELREGTLERLGVAVATAGVEGAMEGLAAMTYPSSSIQDEHHLLAWTEDQLRDTPLGTELSS